MKDKTRLENIEVALFLDALFQRHGYDFRHYAKASIKRRVVALAAALDCDSIAALIPRILHESELLTTVLSQLSVPVTEMFRDPEVFKALRTQILPRLASYPRLQIWQAGCATGEEVYSLAILLEEEGLLERTQIYATDINDLALRQAEEGIFPVSRLKEYERNYAKTGGRGRLSDYYVANAGFFRMDERLRKRIVFAHHNLESDGVFCEVQLILCRNVLIYFDAPLQSKVLNLFHHSLGRNGFLCLGTRESLRAARSAGLFRELVKECMIFQREGNP
jgi:chemotaxis protein methyltransferase CheR